MSVQIAIAQVTYRLCSEDGCIIVTETLVWQPATARKPGTIPIDAMLRTGAPAPASNG